MYAETFDVRSWLETPAKWLRWAMQSLTARNLKDVDYNLQQFWNSLAAIKNSSRTPQEWGEILTLDAQSQWTLGNMYQDTGQELLMNANTFDAFESFAWLGQLQIPNSIMNQLFGQTAKQTLQEYIDVLNQLAEQAFGTAQALSIQAESALSLAGASTGQAGNTIVVASNSSASAPTEAELQRRQAAQMLQPWTWKDLLAALEKPWGIPWYYWAAGAVLLFVLTKPSMPNITIKRDQ